MDTKLNLTDSLNKFIAGAEVQQISIGCSGDTVIKITKNGETFFLKYSGNPGIKLEHDKLKWLQGKLLVPEIISYTEQNGIHYLLTRGLDGEMVCSHNYMQNWQTGLTVIKKAFDTLWKIDGTDCPFNTGLDYKLNHIKNKLDNNLICPDDIRPQYLEKFGGVDGMYKYLVNNRPSEQLVFSHGDTSLPNIFGNGTNLTGFIDVADCGIADIWFDIAVTAKSITRNYNPGATQLFLGYVQNKIGKIDQDKIDYYLTLVEF